jgi:hypothetical protein
MRGASLQRRRLRHLFTVAKELSAGRRRRPPTTSCWNSRANYRADTIFHPAGTCKMGDDAMARRPIQHAEGAPASTGFASSMPSIIAHDWSRATYTTAPRGEWIAEKAGRTMIR